MCFIGKNNDLDMFNDMEEKCPTLRIFLRKDKIIKPIGLICRKGIQNIKNGDSTFHFSFIHPDYGIIKVTKDVLSTKSKFAQEIKLLSDMFYSDIEISQPKFPINFQINFEILIFDNLYYLESLNNYIKDQFNQSH
ncbi:uncharacterized protein OCT59_014532 [Rhizophagus irregularis]|uniref:Uncharacterized protein n=2 Tax=Rhizophagus irregularis TaxID=588596 RepID=A0A916EAJ3_9GLOM|nr:hypothetical protein GLOIN_2v1791620 [Rhizophagus irregularis DAOM 181602=DAOM 197198]UZO22162.1 hypothetical protein OCT59_014532 [Rhizophagus irregularis]POG57591.1 hypothetical protein GLOIN_2v1791620 [Rhizophagus irregularis DAOM 181602=DAOM 197198]CAB4482792.1 unnamed protein product [Rhizophagus irregularis]CAB5199064.1 unnamed protein product [Rhizophagus irregularis]CAB5372290.1 unnamed protein product [Rhizophagus irregularis]|eukprot:XP_025164457.1 hypothetical protein GLOIN_2v1791620 [Rhizophagus irregularis DAOM 181602=DAOM 197198]